MAAGYSITFKTALIIIAFLSIALYNVLELTVSIFHTFRRHSSLYFWCVLLSAWGIIPYCAGFILKFFYPNLQKLVSLTLIAVSWPLMVTGQSLVLYSRLHLIARGRFKTRWVLWMIITNACICHIPIIIVLFGANTAPNPTPFISVYTVYEKIQITIFFLQEVIISGIYVHQTLQLLRSEGNIRRHSRRVMTHLIVVNLIIIALDVTLLAVEYAGLYDIEVTYKPMVYSVKLKMEFNILNQLVLLFQGRLDDDSMDPRSQTYGHHGSELASRNRRRTKIGKLMNGKGEGPLGNSAYVWIEEDGTERRPKGADAVKTTEIRVENRAISREEVELESLEDGIRKERRKSRSSSEAQIIEERC